MAGDRYNGRGSVREFDDTASARRGSRRMSTREGEGRRRSTHGRESRRMSRHSVYNDDARRPSRRQSRRQSMHNNGRQSRRMSRKSFGGSRRMSVRPSMHGGLYE